jgi:hypothetical protein
LALWREKAAKNPFIRAKRYALTLEQLKMPEQKMARTAQQQQSLASGAMLIAMCAHTNV